MRGSAGSDRAPAGSQPPARNLQPRRFPVPIPVGRAYNSGHAEDPAGFDPVRPGPARPPRATGRDSHRTCAVGRAGDGCAHLPAEVRGLPPSHPAQRRHAVRKPSGRRTRRGRPRPCAPGDRGRQRRRHAGLEAHLATGAARRADDLSDNARRLGPAAARPRARRDGGTTRCAGRRAGLAADGDRDRGVGRAPRGGHGLGTAAGAAHHDLGVHRRAGRVRLSPAGERPVPGVGPGGGLGRDPPRGRARRRAAAAGLRAARGRRATSPPSSRGTRSWRRCPRTRRPAAA